MGTVRLLLIPLLLGASLLTVACEPETSGLPREASRQVLLLASEGATIVSAQAAAEGLGGNDTWCVVTESEAGMERWLIFREAQEGQRDVYNLTMPPGPSGFEGRGCTNWDG